MIPAYASAGIYRYPDARGQGVRVMRGWRHAVVRFLRRHAGVVVLVHQYILLGTAAGGIMEAQAPDNKLLLFLVFDLTFIGSVVLVVAAFRSAKAYRLAEGQRAEAGTALVVRPALDGELIEPGDDDESDRYLPDGRPRPNRLPFS